MAMISALSCFSVASAPAFAHSRKRSVLNLVDSLATCPPASIAVPSLSLTTSPQTRCLLTDHFSLLRLRHQQFFLSTHHKEDHAMNHNPCGTKSQDGDFLIEETPAERIAGNHHLLVGPLRPDPPLRR